MVSTLVFKTSKYGFESYQACNYYNMSELEENIIKLRKEGYSYGGIQLVLGNPSKKIIKNCLKQYAPDLLGDVVENNNKLNPIW